MKTNLKIMTPNAALNILLMGFGIFLVTEPCNALDLFCGRVYEYTIQTSVPTGKTTIPTQMVNASGGNKSFSLPEVALDAIKESYNKNTDICVGADGAFTQVKRVSKR